MGTLYFGPPSTLYIFSRYVVRLKNLHMIQCMTGSTGPALKKDIVNKLLREEDDLKVIICTPILSMGVDMTGK